MIRAAPASASTTEGGGLGRGARFILLSQLAAACLVCNTLAVAAATSSPERLVSPPRIQTLGIAQGLSQSSVTAIAQDTRGFLWVGTQDGLNRFDGYEFRRYMADPGDPLALDDATITALAVHPDGAIWVGTQNEGVARHDPRDDAFVHMRAAGEKDQTPLRWVTAIAVDTSAAVWVGTRGGLARVTAPVPAAPQLELLDDRPVASLHAGRSGLIWVGRRSGQLEAYPSGAHAPIHSFDPFDGRASVRAIAEDAGGALWIAGENDELVRISTDGTIEASFAIGSEGPGETPGLRALLLDDGGHVWIGGLATGIAVLDPGSGRIRQLRRSAFDRSGLSDDDVLALHRDSYGTLWIGTLSGGLARMRHAQPAFVSYWNRPDDPSSLSYDVVTSFALQADGALWIGTDGGGLNRLELGTDRFEHVSLPGDAPGRTRIWALHAAPDGTLWAGTWGAGLYRLRSGKPLFEPLQKVPGRIITSIAGDEDNLWIGSADAGIVRLSHDGAVSRTALSVGSNVSALLVDGDELWAGLWGDGLVRMSRQGEVLQHLRHRPGVHESLPHNSVRDLLLDRNGGFWVATSAGLAKLNRGSGQVERFGRSIGLPGGSVYAVQEDDAGELWLSTNDGLVRFNPRSAAVRRYLPEDGVQDYEFTSRARLRLPDGRLLFGGVGGFNLVDPSRVTPGIPPGRVEIVDVLLAGEVERPRAHVPGSPLDVAATELESLTLGHRNTQLSFRFALPLPEAPGQITYAYKLEGLDLDWRLVDSDQRTAVYTHLSPGDYTFRVRARNADGLWSTADRTLHLHMLPPWWASRWAYVAYALSGALAILLFVQWRTHSLRQRSRRLRAEVDERTAQLSRQNAFIEEQTRQLQHALDTKERLFARVSHEFRTPLTLILGPIESLLADERDARASAWLRLMRRSARRLLVLVDQLLGLARLSGEAPLQLSPQRVAPVLRGTVAAFESAAVSKGVALEIDHLDDAWVLATPEALERIIANLVANAVKYTRAGGHIRTSLRNESEEIVLVVADDGPGIAAGDQARIFEPFQRGDASGEGTGLGLALVKESVQALGGSIGLDSAPDHGAEFTVRLPPCPPPAAGAEEPDESLVSERVLLVSAVASSELRRPADDVLAADLAEQTPADDRPRILIVEDNADLRAVLIAALAPSYRCLTAADGPTGVELALEDPPELVISDVLMPGMDGFELTETLKRDERTSHVPIVLLTALGDRESRLHGLAERADDYLVKPFDADELLLRVRNLVESREITRQHAARRLYDSGRPIADTGPEEIAHGPREQAFLERLRAAALRGYADAEFGVSELADRVAMSERQLQRKVRALLGVSPADYLRELRLQQAADRLRRGELLGNVAFDVGFASRSHFGACFKARFGMTPGEFVARPPAH